MTQIVRLRAQQQRRRNGGYAFTLPLIIHPLPSKAPILIPLALTLAATNYNFLHTYIDHDYPTIGFTPSKVPSPQQLALTQAARTTSPLEILEKIRADSKFDNLFDTPGTVDIEKLFAEREEAVLGYYYKLDMRDLVSVHRDITRLSVLLLCATHEPGRPVYDFFFVHLLTLSYAVRTLLPVVPEKYALPLCKSHWLFMVIVYILQLRPEIRPGLVEEVEVGGKGWGEVVKETLGRGEGVDTHYLKAVRALRNSAALWKEDGDFFLRAGVKFAWEFEKWGGFESQEVN